MIKEKYTDLLFNRLEKSIADWTKLAGFGSQTEEAHYARGVVYGLRYSLDYIKIFNEPSQ